MHNIYFCGNLLNGYKEYSFYPFKYKAQIEMKKFARLVIVLSAVAMFFGACKAHEKCPAYGQMNKPKVNRMIIG